MPVLFTVDVRGVDFQTIDLLLAKEEFLKSFRNVEDRTLDAPSVGFTSKGACNVGRVNELCSLVQGLAMQNPGVMISLALEDDDMHNSGGYVAYFGGRKIADVGGDCSHLAEGWYDPKYEPMLERHRNQKRLTT